MSTTIRRRWGAEEKLAILEEARQTGQSISEVCRRHQVAAGQFYAWERQARQGAISALSNSKPGGKGPDASEGLIQNIQGLQTVLAELLAEKRSLRKGAWPGSRE